MKRASLALTLCGLLVGVSGGCGKKKQKEIDSLLLTPRETYRLAREEIQRDNLRRAIQLLSRVDYRLGDDRSTLEPLVELATADATFYQNNDIALINARHLYLGFVTIYPDHTLAPYAQYQAGVCSLSQVSSPSKDQTETYQAIRDLREAETRYPASSYAVAARLMRRDAEARLAEHELMVGRFYLKKKAYPAAIERFQKALSEFPDSSKTGDMYLSMGEAMLRSGDSDQGRFYLDRVINDYAGTGLDKEAQQVITTVSNATRKADAKSVQSSKD